jgi:NADH-quinone oxidoreductase subunit H
MPVILWIIIETLIKGIVLMTIILLGAATSVYMERKVSAFIQNRLGPNRVGPFGLLQPFADVMKLFMKEDIVPDAADKRFHRLAPIISIGVAISVYAVIPLAHYIQIGGKIIYMGVAPNLNIGILFILAMTSVGVYGITLAGWSSNNKYSLLGALRSSAQMISYELSMGLSLLGVILIAGSFSLTDIVLGQKGFYWNVLLQPLGFIIFFISSFAEANRTPFDLPEAEPELVGGYNTEYTGMKFGMFYLSEYANMATSSAIITILYLGGWQLPFSFGLPTGSIQLALAQFIFFLMKILILIFFFIWVRWTVPRFRYDQLMNLGWKVLLPLSILNVILTGIGVLIFR